MATIAHISDVHFGRHEPDIVAALETWLLERRPELVVISGDFTQRARIEQYKAACRFVDRLEAGGLDVLGVPGNHDVPLYDVFRRFARPLNRYRRYIDEDLCPWFESDRLAVLGINTARSLTIKDGRINHEQMRTIRERFRAVPEEKTRILVTHHPLFAMPIGDEAELTKRVGRHEDALLAVADAGVHILLAGHFHRSYVRSARDMVENAGPALVIQAGTATSNRLRADEVQSLNWIHAHRNDEIDLQVFGWDGSAFAGGSHARYSFDGERWHSRAPAPVQE
ncbi:metallophosphoesterase family protein [Sphingosinicella humi]|uniref:Phosphohydrolase n=1 Tax=Allosphingosinicella humi TaxID=2068657 RepID=A0A2U2J015_9SPHN|nr:metallophosphoesterase [Sphingosinicella humi]PWG01679.1 phosphohydrolase [Sphingosinicella humi]